MTDTPMTRLLKYSGWFLGALLLLFSGPILLAATGTQPERNAWQTASRDSAGIAPAAAPPLVRRPARVVCGYPGR